MWSRGAHFVDRRNEEDALSATLYSDLPYPENRLVALAHSLVVAASSMRPSLSNGWRLSGRG